MSLFAKIFGKKDQPEPQAKSESVVIKQKELRDFFIDEIEKSPYIKESGKNDVLQHCLHEKNLLSGTELTKEEKKILGFNVRAKVTKELVDVLSDEGVSNHTSPREAINLIYNSANIKHVRYERIVNSLENGIKEFIIMSDHNDNACLWCRSLNGTRVKVSLDIITSIEDNCTCQPYCTIGLRPVINFDD